MRKWYKARGKRGKIIAVRKDNFNGQLSIKGTDRIANAKAKEEEWDGGKCSPMVPWYFVKYKKE